MTEKRERITEKMTRERIPGEKEGRNR